MALSPESMTAQPTSSVVTVYLKHPAGIVLRAHKFHDEVELVMGGGTRDVKVGRFTGEQMTLNGTAAPFGQARRDVHNPDEFVRMVAGFAVTSNVPKSLWDNWYEHNRQSDLVRNGLIYAHEKTREGDAFAKEHASVRTGLEPLIQTVADGGGRIIATDPRAPRSPARDERPAAAA